MIEDLTEAVGAVEGRVRLVAVGAGAILVSGCSPPVMFAVDVDEPIAGGTLMLNARFTELMRDAGGTYTARWDGADGSGSIAIRYPDGATISCRIGYVTNGLREVQRFVVRARQCEQVRA